MEEVALLLDLGIIVVAATLMLYLNKLLKQPTVIMYIAAGVLLGPAFIRLALPFANLSVGFGVVSDPGAIGAISSLGIALMLFAIGMESDIKKILHLGKVLVAGSIFQVANTALITALLVRIAGLPLMESVYIGLAVAFSSTMLVVKILTDSNRMDSLTGRLAIGFLLLQDVLVILVMPLLSNFSNLFDVSFISGIVFAGFALLAAGFALNQYVLPRLVGDFAKSEEFFYLAVLSTCFAFIFLANIVGFSPAIGAFIGGLSLSSLPNHLEAHKKIKSLRDFFVTIFVVSLGMQLGLGFDLAYLAEQWVIFAIILACTFALKPLLFAGLLFFSGYGGKVSQEVGLSLAQVSEFSLILAAQGLALNHISNQLFSMVVLSLAVSMTVSPYFIKYNAQINAAIRRIFRGFEHFAARERFHSKIRELHNVPDGKMKNHIVLVGAGALGEDLAFALKAKSESVLAVDHNPLVAAELIEKGIHTLCMSSDNEELGERANLGEAKVLSIAIRNRKETEALMARARAASSEIKIIGRAHTIGDALELYESGADAVVIPDMLGSKEFLRHISNALQSPGAELSAFKSEFMDYLREKSKERHYREKMVEMVASVFRG